MLSVNLNGAAGGAVLANKEFPKLASCIAEEEAERAGPGTSISVLSELSVAAPVLLGELWDSSCPCHKLS